MPEQVPLVLFALGMTAGALMDLFTRRSPNWLTVPMLFLGLALAGLSGGASGLLESLGGAGVGLGLLVVPFALGLLGGGDVKFVTAMGAWLGPSGNLVAIVLGFVTGGAICAAILFSRSELRREVSTNLRNAILSRSLPRVEHRSPQFAVPLVAAMAVGGIGAWLAGVGL